MSLGNEIMNNASQGYNLHKTRVILWAEHYFCVKALTLHFKAQQTYMSTTFAFTGKQSLVTAQLYFYYKLSLHPIHVKSTSR